MCPGAKRKAPSIIAAPTTPCPPPCGIGIIPVISFSSKPLLAFSLLSPAGAHFSVALLATPRTLCPFSEMGTVETHFRRQKDEDNDAPRLFSKNLTFHLGRGAGSDWAKRLVKIENRPPTPSTR
eukprot:m.366335 g.366335  ORF g.366335 m.366335 type:complete len:124 (-) comp16659_c0_seq2:1550-1921(-)